MRQNELPDLQPVPFFDPRARYSMNMFDLEALETRGVTVYKVKPMDAQ